MVRKNKNQKGQAAMEYLQTYGWALLIIIVVMGVIFVMMAQVSAPQYFAGENGWMAAPILPVISQDGHFIGKITQATGNRLYIYGSLCIDKEIPASFSDARTQKVNTVDGYIYVKHGGDFLTYTNQLDTVCYSNLDPVNLDERSFSGHLYIFYKYENDLTMRIMHAPFNVEVLKGNASIVAGSVSDDLGGGSGSSCSSESDCLADYVCILGICSDETNPCENVLCPPDQSCVNGVCEGEDTCISSQLEEGECCTDDDCEDNEMCTDGLCEGIPCECGNIEEHECIEYECCENTDCEIGNVCENNECASVDCSFSPDANPQFFECMDVIYNLYKVRNDISFNCGNSALCFGLERNLGMTVCHKFYDHDTSCSYGGYDYYVRVYPDNECFINVDCPGSQLCVRDGNTNVCESAPSIFKDFNLILNKGPLYPEVDLFVHDQGEEQAFLKKYSDNAYEVVFEDGGSGFCDDVGISVYREGPYTRLQPNFAISSWKDPVYAEFDLSGSKTVKMYVDGEEYSEQTGSSVSFKLWDDLNKPFGNVYEFYVVEDYEEMCGPLK